MTNEQAQVKTWMQQFGQETPEKPTIPSLEVRKLRAKLILEEALETIEALGFGVSGHSYEGTMDLLELEGFDHAPEEEIIVAILDGCEDLKVVTEGTLAACGLLQIVEPEPVHSGVTSGYGPEIKVDLAFNEVMRSNFSKLWTVDDLMKHCGIPIDARDMVTLSETYECTLNNQVYYHAKKRDTGTDRCWLVKDKDGKVIKSPSYSPANLQQFISTTEPKKT